MRVVKITASLKVRVSQPLEGLESLLVLAILDEPTGRLGAEVDLGAAKERHDNSRAQNQSPGQVGSEATKCDTHDVTDLVKKVLSVFWLSIPKEKACLDCMAIWTDGAESVLNAYGDLLTIIPKAVQTCHCMTRAPRIRAGAHSAA